MTQPAMAPANPGRLLPFPARLLLALTLMLAMVVAPIRPTAPASVGAAGPACATSGPSSGAYTMTVCISTSGGTVLSGDVTVTTTVTADSGTLPTISRISVKSARGTTSTSFSSVLSDFAAPYTFTLPTYRWVDGIYRLRAEVTLPDGFVPAMPVLQVSYANNVTAEPASDGSWAPRSAGGGSAVVAAVGDGAGGLPGAAAVGSLVAGWNPAMFLYIGDVYNSGTFTEFYNYYAPTLGGLAGVTNPVPGNHETGNSLRGYFDYWNSSSNTRYYSTTAGSWHVVALDSNLDASAGSAQYAWLDQDLQNHAGQCTLVTYHHPRYGLTSSGGNTSMDAVWQLMAQRGVDVVLSGHEHNYQRWQPLDGAGSVSPGGITQFVVGTGGHQRQGFAISDSRVAKRISTADGALRLTLSGSGADFQFISTAGSTLDSGSAGCNDAPETATPTPTPTVGAGEFTFTPVADSRVEEANPGVNYGTNTLLRVDGGSGPDVESYLKFDVSGVGGAVTSARLRIFAGSGSVDGPAVYTVADTSWTETGITWTNRPGRTEPFLSDSADVATGAWIELDVTAAVTGNGTYSFALATGSTDGTDMRSRETSTDPELVVTFGDGPPPPTLTPVPTNTEAPTDTPVPTDTPTPTDTPSGPTDTPVPTDTPEPPTDTPVPPTDTPVPPTDTPVPPTDTPIPTDTPLPTDTPVPTNTPLPPTNTPVPLVWSITRTDGGGSTVPSGYVATFSVCVNPSPTDSVTVYLKINNPTRATAAPESLTYTPGGPTCQDATMTDRTDSGGRSGKARLEVYAARSGNTYTGLLASSVQITFP